MLTIKREHLAEVLEHCRREAPLEACGILAGREGVVTRVYPMTNVDHSRTSYLMDPREQFKVMDEIWSRGEELVGIYHSHPHSAAYPSPRDVEMAYYPDSYWVIISLAGEPVVKAFRIAGGQILETEIRVVRGEGKPGNDFPRGFGGTQNVL